MYNSAELICEGLAEVLMRKPYGEISITDICSPKGIARTTFYRLFDTLEDVLMYQFDCLFEQSLWAYKKNGNPQYSFTRTIIDIAISDKALITAIIASGRSDLFLQSTKVRENIILQEINLTLSEKDKLYCTSILTQLAYVVLSTWVATGCKESSESLYEIIRREIKTIYENI